MCWANFHFILKIWTLNISYISTSHSLKSGQSYIVIGFYEHLKFINQMELSVLISLQSSIIKKLYFFFYWAITNKYLYLTLELLHEQPFLRKNGFRNETYPVLSPTFARRMWNVPCLAIMLKSTKNQYGILNPPSLPHSRCCCHPFCNVFFPSEVARLLPIGCYNCR